MLNAEALTAILTGIVLPSAIVITLTFVPSIVEWKHPRDKGPRPIPGFYKTVPITPKSSLLDLDAENGSQLVPKSFIFPIHISNIEA